MEMWSGKRISLGCLQTGTRFSSRLRRGQIRNLYFREAHSEMYFYTWGDSECCLAKGATQATLLDEARTTDSNTPK